MCGKHIDCEEEDEECHIDYEYVHKHLCGPLVLRLFLNLGINCRDHKHALDIACGLARPHNQGNYAACHIGFDPVLKVPQCVSHDRAPRYVSDDLFQLVLQNPDLCLRNHCDGIDELDARIIHARKLSHKLRELVFDLPYPAIPEFTEYDERDTHDQGGKEDLIVQRGDEADVNARDRANACAA